MEMKMLHKEERKDDATNNFTSVAHLLQDTDMARVADVENSIRAALLLDAKRMTEISGDMQTLEEQYNRYLALRRERDTHEKSMESLVALLGPEGYRKALRSDESDLLGEEFNFLQKSRLLREKAALWEHIAQYLRFVPEAQVNDILEFLAYEGIEASRQAVESSIKTHSKIFRTKNRGREKYISLK
jgi:hypothetical protein